MNFFPHHALQLCNAGWFSLCYGLMSVSIMILRPGEKRKRVVTFPRFKSRSEKILSGLALLIFGRGLILYSCFVPINFNTVNFYFGTTLYLIGLISSMAAMWTFTGSDTEKPVTGGIFKITRHPMQNVSVVMWIGIGLIAGNWVIIACALFLAIISFPSLKAQERSCMEKYGAEYIDYMKKTPRYFSVRSVIRGSGSVQKKARRPLLRSTPGSCDRSRMPAARPVGLPHSSDRRGIGTLP